VERITSLQNPRWKMACSLRDRRPRKKSGWTLIDGVRECAYALESGAIVESLWIPESLWEGDAIAAEAHRDLDWLVQRVQENRQGGVFLVPDRMFEALTFGDRSSSVVAVATWSPQPLAHLQAPSDRPVLILDRFEKPGNIGAAFRTAEASGAAAVILCDPMCDVDNPNAIRASQGSLFLVPCAVASAEQTLAWLGEQQRQAYAARVDATDCYTSLPLQQSHAWVIGNEAMGVQDAWRRGPVRPVRIPMQGKLDSLNASVTVGILLYESLRQRNGEKEGKIPC
jgi:TrmH family RNA methyltransferase